MSAISFVLLVLNAWMTVIICSAQNQGLNPSTRGDAEQDPMIAVSVVPSEDSPKSVLFDSCFTSLRTVSVRFASIVAGRNNIEYNRYVPDSQMIANARVPWKTVSVTGTILDCADAVADAGYPMFTYDGACLAANNSYDTTITPACENNDTNAVFINNAAAVPCMYPGLTVGTTGCIRVFPSQSYLVTDASSLCKLDKQFKIFSNDLQNYDAVVATLNQNGYDNIKLIVDSYYASDPGGTIGLYYSWPNSSYFVNAGDINKDGTVYMDPAHKFLLQIDTTKEVRMGLLCHKLM